MSLEGKTLFITGASRGIGLAIALKAAKDGANIILAAKTAEPHPKLPGTIYTAADEIEKAGGMALPVIVDVREEGQVLTAVEEGLKKVFNLLGKRGRAGFLDFNHSKFNSVYDIFQKIYLRLVVVPISKIFKLSKEYSYIEKSIKIL